MRVMVLGAAGFIGRHIVAALLGAGHDVVAVVRHIGHLAEAMPAVRFIEADLGAATDAAAWVGRLEGIDCIVNVAGILRGSTMDAVHVAMPTVLYAAAAKSGVRRVILVSAISARDDVATDYARSKLAGEAALRATALEWTILRPSLVYGDGSYGGTSLLRGLAGLPLFVPLPGAGDQLFTPIHVADLARGVVLVCDATGFAGRTLEPVGPDTVQLRELLRQYRAWLGLGRARFLSIPMPVMRVLGRLGDVMGDGPIASNSLAQLVAGNAGDGAAYARDIGFAQRGIDAALLAHPAEVQDRWHARLFFLAPAIRATLVFLWIASAWLGLAHGQEATRDLVAAMGVSPVLADPLRIGSVLADLAVAALLLFDRKARLSTIVQIALICGYSAVIGFALPSLWFDPLGPLLKNLPILLLVAVHGAIGDKR